jgi:alkanesulfonate monooxygenase SsuD/methylene tetrahydromethanopterin reductase-like flavin-dependent oxidoreductase (luciferase family)
MQSIRSRSARDMDPAKLKREFGRRSGSNDTQRILGTPQEVRDEVRKMIDCLGAGDIF